MQRLRKDNAFWFVVVIVAALMFAMTANAGGKPPPHPKPVPQDQSQRQGQDQSQHTNIDLDSELNLANELNVSNSAAGGNAVNDGNELNVTQNYESGPADLVLVPNNNTETCLRVIGLAFGNDNASGMLGFPYRSAKCDFEQAADDAFAAGERDLGWFWKCKNKNLAKTFRDKGESLEKASKDCYDHAVGAMTDKKRAEYLAEKVRILQEEQTARRLQHEDTVKRLQSDCEESKDRILEGCMK